MTNAQHDGDEDEFGGEPVGFLGRVRAHKGLAWLTIIGLVALTIGATTIIWLAQVGLIGR